MPRIANERAFTPLATTPSGTHARDRRRGIAKLVETYRGPAGAGRGSVARLLDGIGGLGWSVIGFVGGAVFWHFIGFWTFVADVVLAGGTSASALPSAEARREWVRMAEAEPVHACTVLSLDRETGRTSASACLALRPLPADHGNGREDRLAANPRR